MNRSSWMRRTALTFAALALPASALAVGVTTAQADATWPASSALTEPVETTRVAPSRTKVTFTADDCEGCQMSLASAVWGKRGHVPKVWSSRTKEFSDGQVTFTVPTRRTHGMSAVVTAPWEGSTGYVTEVVWRYTGAYVGREVTTREARLTHSGFGCWFGTKSQAATIPLVIKRVRVRGIGGMVNGTIAFAAPTQRAMAPKQRVYRGVMGTQDVQFCGRQR